MSGAHDPFAAFERKWLAARPENALIPLFLPDERRVAAVAFGSLVYELEQTAAAAREPQVAATKLAWWRRELADAHAGNARHPIAMRLFGDARVRASAATLWPVLAETAAARIGLRCAADTGALLERLRPWQSAVARAQALILNVPEADAEAVAELSALSHLLHSLALARTCGDRVPLPLDLLGSHELGVDGIGQDTSAARAFTHSYLNELGTRIRAATESRRPRNLPVRVRTRLDSDLIRAAERARDPLTVLARRARTGYWRSLRVCWSEAHRLAREAGRP